MKISVKTEDDIVYGCNFCNSIAGKHYLYTYSFIRNEGNSLQATICDNCLQELINFRQKHLEKIF